VDGYKIEWRLARIHKEMGLRRTLGGMDIKALEEDQNRLEAIIEQELGDGVTESYGQNRRRKYILDLTVINAEYEQDSSGKIY